MSESKSHDEVRADYVAAMGDKLGRLFHVLSTELVWLHSLWKQYRILFGDKPARIDLLNETAPFFFRTVQDVFFEDTLLALARLIGPPKSAGKPNLSRIRGRRRASALAGLRRSSSRSRQRVQSLLRGSHPRLKLRIGVGPQIHESRTELRCPSGLSVLRVQVAQALEYNGPLDGGFEKEQVHGLGPLLPGVDGLVGRSRLLDEVGALGQEAARATLAHLIHKL